MFETLRTSLRNVDRPKFATPHHEAEDYFLSADGLLMPTKKDQPPPDLRYFNPRK
jgi:hypothetical protein